MKNALANFVLDGAARALERNEKRGNVQAKRMAIRARRREQNHSQSPPSRTMIGAMGLFTADTLFQLSPCFSERPMSDDPYYQL